MRHLMDIFFSQSEMINSMTWDFFVEQIGQYMTHQPLEFHRVLQSYIEGIALNSKSYNSPNVNGLFILISHKFDIFLNSIFFINFDGKSVIYDAHARTRNFSTRAANSNLDFCDAHARKLISNTHAHNDNLDFGTAHVSENNPNTAAVTSNLTFSSAHDQNLTFNTHAQYNNLNNSTAHVHNSSSNTHAQPNNLNFTNGHAQNLISDTHAQNTNIPALNNSLNSGSAHEQNLGYIPHAQADDITALDAHVRKLSFDTHEQNVSSVFENAHVQNSSFSAHVQSQPPTLNNTPAKNNTSTFSNTPKNTTTSFTSAQDIPIPTPVDKRTPAQIKADYEYILTCIKYFRYILQIASLNSAGSEFDLFAHERVEFSKLLTYYFKYLLKCGSKYPVLTDEILITFMIICFSQYKSEIKMEFIEHVCHPYNEILMLAFLHKLTSLYFGIFAKDNSWSGYFYKTARYYADALTWGLISNKPDCMNVYISNHSLFLLCFFLFSQECADMATKYTNNLNVEKGVNLMIPPEIIQPASGDCFAIETCPDMRVDDFFRYISSEVDNELLTMFLYALIRNNPKIKEAFCVSAHADKTVIKLCELLYFNHKLGHYQSCLVLIILLALTCDNNFTAFLHARTIPKFEWFREQYRCDDWNVSNLAYFCIIKALKRNHDEFAQENFIGNMINLTFGDIRLNCEVSQQLVLLLKISLKEFSLKLSESKSENKGSISLACIEKRIFSVLQIINIILAYHLITHPDLIHQLILLKQNNIELFEMMKDYPRFHEEYTNISTLVNFYEFKFSQLVEKFGTLNPVEITKHIKEFAENSSIIISYSKPRHVFEFHEDSSSHVFFISYLKFIFQNQDFLC